MLTESLATLMDVIDAQFSIAYLLENEQLCVATWHGLSDAMLAEAGSPEFMQQLLLEKADVHRELKHQETGQIPPVAKAEGVQSWVSLPLRGRGHPVGIVVFASREYDRFDDATIDFLAAASEQIALGLRNAQLFAETQRRARELELINQATHAASSTLNLETVLQTIMTQAVEVLQAEAGSVMLLEEPDGDLVFAVAAGPGGEQLRGTHVPVASSIAGQAVREGRSLIIGDAQRDMRLLSARWTAQRLDDAKSAGRAAVGPRAHHRRAGSHEQTQRQILAWPTWRCWRRWLGRRPRPSKTRGCTKRRCATPKKSSARRHSSSARKNWPPPGGWP